MFKKNINLVVLATLFSILIFLFNCEELTLYTLDELEAMRPNASTTLAIVDPTTTIDETSTTSTIAGTTTTTVAGTTTTTIAGTTTTTIAGTTTTTVAGTTTTTVAGTTTTTVAGTTTTTIPNGNVRITISLSSPEIASIIFDKASGFAIAKGSDLIITATFVGGTNWKWYIDNVLLSEITSTLTWNSGGANVGKHYLSVTTEKNGVRYSGSLSFVVTQ
ncbi:MAG: hypothetical protein KA885_00815 [Spirochaetes bacterium]|nr:hypothetical protein [Spirochaetota bacterium]